MSDSNLREHLEGFRGEPGQQRAPARGGEEFADGKAHSVDFGVQYQGAYETMADGTNRAVRLHARALAAAGLPVLLQSFSRTMFDPGSGAIVPVHQNAQYEEVLREVGSLVGASVQSTPVRIKHAVIDDASKLERVIVPTSLYHQKDMFEYIEQILGTTIVYSVWERTKIPEATVKLLSRVAECWVPCHQNAEMLRAHGIEQVEVVPHPYPEDSPIRKLWSHREKGTVGSLRWEPMRFYSIGAWQPRKGLHELLGAFLCGYEPTGIATLALRTTDARVPGYPTIRESIEHWLNNEFVRANGWRGENLSTCIALFEKNLSEEQMVKLHSNNNIYVSSSHGEAWGLPAFDAKLCGNHLVHVPFGGTADFCDPPDVDPQVPFTMGKVHPAYRWDGEWAEFTVKGLADAMKAVRLGAETGRKMSFFSMKVVGEFMRERVLEIAKRRVPKAYEAWTVSK